MMHRQNLAFLYVAQAGFMALPYPEIKRKNFETLGHGGCPDGLTHKTVQEKEPNEPPHDKTNKMICAPSED